MADYYEILERLNYGSEQWQALSRLLREIMDSVTGHDHDGTDSPGASLAGAGITADAAEINVLDGVTAGTATASKAAVLGATKNLDTLLIDVAEPTAAGNNQATATAMTADTNLAKAADGTKGVKLPTAVAGRRVIVKNTVENQILKVYPATGAAINAIGANGPIELPAGCLALFVAYSATQWFTSAIPDGITSTAAELNKLDGAGANVTAANLDTLTGGSDIARAAGGHGHLLAAGGSDVTASAAEVNSTCDGNTASAAEITQVCDGAGATATAANLTSLTDGSNADSLHDHAYPNDVAFFDPDTATSGALLTRYTCPDRTVNFAANFSGSKATASAAATAQAIYSIQKNGVEVGTITFAVAATEGTFVSTGGAAVQLTGTTPDVLTVVAPAYADATLADVSVTLKGSI